MEQAQRPNKAPAAVAVVPSVTAGGLPPLAEWLPSILWMGALFLLSTSLFSATNTSKVLEPLLRWMFPSASLATITLMHALIRKAAHFGNYCILFWLLIRGPLKGRPYAALGCCVIYAALDETHQIFSAGRGASIYDVAIDSSGALFGRFLNSAIYDVS